MKRLIGSLLIVVALVVCSCKGPKPTDTPSATETINTTLTPELTLTPLGSPMPRITIVPSATPLPKTPSAGPSAADASPTNTIERQATSVLPPTLTPRIVDASVTVTPLATSPPPDSPLPTPTLLRSPLALPPETPSPSPESTQLPTSTVSSATPTTFTSVPSFSTSTPTASATSAPVEGDWDFENIYTYYDDAFQEFYIWGDLVNHTGDYQRVTTLWPVVYDEVGEAVTTKDDVNAIGSGYKDLREGISLALDQSLAFSFQVYLPEGVAVEDNYEIVVESKPAEQGRDDLEIPYENFDDDAWPLLFFVEGTFEIPAPDLNEYVAVVVTLYDDQDRVIGVGWLYEESSTYLTTGSHDFSIEVEMWDVAYDLELEVYFYKVQVFGY